MIGIGGLTKNYGHGSKAAQALRRVDLQIPSGMFGLLGPNGVGKTTLMRILAGIVHPSRGTVRVDRRRHASCWRSGSGGRRPSETEVKHGLSRR